MSYKDTSENNICPSCGAKNFKGDGICKNCGRIIEIKADSRRDYRKIWNFVAIIIIAMSLYGGINYFTSNQNSYENDSGTYEGQDPYEHTSDDYDTSSFYPVDNSGFNIGSNLKFYPDGTDTILENDYFSVQFPTDIEWGYEILANTALEIFHKSARDSGYGGWVVTIIAYDWEDDSYEQFPSWALAGTSADKKYIVQFPTDVQFDSQDSTQSSEYREMLSIAEDMDCNDNDAYNLFKVK